MLNLEIEFTPVDYCAKFIVHLSKNMYNNLNIYHLFNNNLITFKNFIEILSLYGYNLKTISLEDFKKIILNSNKNSFGITNYLSILDNKNTSSLTIDNSYTNLLLNTSNLNWPCISQKYIKKIINYLKKYNFIGDTYEN